MKTQTQLSALIAAALISTIAASAGEDNLASPDGRLVVTVQLTDGGSPVYQVQRDGTTVLERSKLGLVREDADFSRGLKQLGVGETSDVNDSYELPGSKRLKNIYQAKRRVWTFGHGDVGRMEVIFQVSNDSVAFRYVFPETSEKVHPLKEEVSSFKFPEGTRAWLQPIAEAQFGWCRVNPSYEEYYEIDSPVGKPSTLGAGWVYPALFRTGETWLLLSETGLGRGYCATRLRHESPGGEYSVGFADPRENGFGKPAHPRSTLPWTTPWRIMAIGSLKTVMESSLGTDLADAPAKPMAHPKPGKASWSWVLLKDEQTIFETQKRFVDYAAEMGWEHCLVDALWDTQIGYEKIRELCSYAAGKGVKIHVWYNSNGDWNDAPQTPIRKLDNRESRLREFALLKDMGVAGLKIDFFNGDGQPMIDYYLDLLEDSAKFGLMMNFHGCTLPRGWQRTYPHLMTMESVRGMEYITFEQENADRAPSHMAMIPFARNVFDPMDFTPVVLDRIPKIRRHTSSAFELATAVLYTSGIQHYAETPDGMAKAPDYVRQLLKEIPGLWEDSRFLTGVPGEHVVIARKASGRWFVAGIHAGKQPLQLVLDLRELGSHAKATLVTDGDEDPLGFRKQELEIPADGRLPLTIQPNGGFVMTLGN